MKNRNEDEEKRFFEKIKRIKEESRAEHLPMDFGEATVILIREESISQEELESFNLTDDQWASICYAADEEEMEDLKNLSHKKVREMIRDRT